MLSATVDGDFWYLDMYDHLSLPTTFARTCVNGQRASLHLVAHLADGVWRWADKPDSCFCTGLGKVCPFRKETVAWVDSIHLVVLEESEASAGYLQGE